MNTNQINKPETESFDRRTARRQRIDDRRAARGRGTGTPWVGGLVLIGLGVLFLIQNFYSISLDNWWGLIFLIPALGAFANAWGDYSKEAKLTAQGRGSLFGGIALVLLTAIVLFDLDWGIFIPILIILTGIGLLLNRTVLD